MHDIIVRWGAYRVGGAVQSRRQVRIFMMTPFSGTGEAVVMQRRSGVGRTAERGKKTRDTTQRTAWGHIVHQCPPLSYMRATARRVATARRTTVI